MKLSLSTEAFDRVLSEIDRANTRFNAAFPGESDRRQPVHTVYGGAHLFKSDTAAKLGALAQKSLEAYAPDCVSFARALQLPGADGLPDPDLAEIVATRVRSNPGKMRTEAPDSWYASTLYDRVCDKLTREPVEDFRLDFEDGYGNRPDEEEDAHALSAASEVAAGLEAGSLPPFIGIRIKPFSQDLKKRALRTLDIFLTAMLDRTGNRLPENFVVTLPKVQLPEQVAALVSVFETLEARHSLAEGSLRLEIMIETPQAIVDSSGRIVMPALIAAAKNRCAGAHFGVYDYTASRGIIADYQHMRHPACDFAREIMCITLAQTGVPFSDGATNILPVGPHRANDPDSPLTAAQETGNREAVHDAWRLAFADTSHSLQHGIYQGWDLHPAQLPVRYAAVYDFFLRGLESSAARLHAFVAKAAKASLMGDVFDDAATGQGLLNFFIRGLSCGALTPDEAAATGLTMDELRLRSFLKILQTRTEHRSQE